MKHTILLLLIGLYLPFFSTAQHVYTLEQIFELTLKNNQSLKISNSAVEVAKQRVEVAKLQRLPNLDASLTAGYMGDALVIDKDFSSSTRIPVPHFTNTFALEASQVIFKGNAVNNSIANTSLQEQVSLLNMQENTLGINLLVAGNYLDLYAYYNQRNVYEQNIALAEMRLAQIEKFYHQGMVTRNDVIRSELQIADLNLALESVKNQINVVNKQLAMATGLPDSVSILPDTTILNRNLSISSLEASQQTALKTHPAIQSADIRTQIAEKNLAITKADRLPTLSAFAGNNMQRPITTSSPAVDKYSNGWQAGFSLSYNIASLYDAAKNIHLSKLQVDEANEQAILARQNKEVAVNAVYIAHQEALTRAQTLQQNVRLANENYRIIEKKYMNQLALLVDMLDASNAKLGAELQQTNAAINVLYTYYQLQAEIGAQ
ncbi:TolC family protein [Sphingobacterium sp. JB170]|uniref:TolC family protein n=1 Tax=Sphingobacterium sp. JB170 TaxID=1434842 RepID=UPI00097E76F3|nr:TolC family protein [Sphingobacterium sp. JB170]SJN49315.1 Outer membrane component of tripartite multidrug resistance system [Sphingobacterium sp. JB170]